MKRRLKEIHNLVKPHWNRALLFVGGSLVLLTGAQLVYPSDHLALFTKIDGVSLSGWRKTDAIKKLDADYVNATISVYFGQATNAYRTPKTTEIGLTVSNEKRVNVSGYPWYLRIVPTSIFWAHLLTESVLDPQYQRNSDKLAAYINKELGTSCSVEPRDASLKVSGETLVVVSSQSGGTCQVSTVQQTLSGVKPRLNSDNIVKIPVKELAPGVTDSAARQLGDYLQGKVGKGVSMTVNGTAVTISASELYGWMDFSASDSQLIYSFNEDRALVYLNKEIAPKVAVSAGTTTVATYNFVETSRVNGASGRQLDVSATLENIKSFLDGASQQATVATETVLPRVSYTRSYSPTDTGLSALMQQFAQEHSGVFGVSMIELTGQGRRASYNDTKSFTTASTYKLFVAYSALKRVEEGKWHWTDQITGGRNLSTCLDDMIVKSDNACGAALLLKIGDPITDEIHAIGCVNSSFRGNDGIKTTAADLALFLAELHTGQILTQQTSRNLLINAMERNIYRSGIPAGIGSATVADKVGFMDGLLHDAAIVYSPTGTYVLVIMSSGSSWSTIADLAGRIEALRN